MREYKLIFPQNLSIYDAEILSDSTTTASNIARAYLMQLPGFVQVQCSDEDAPALWMMPILQANIVQPLDIRKYTAIKQRVFHFKYETFTWECEVLFDRGEESELE